jgi:hypothetical protein
MPVEYLTRDMEDRTDGTVSTMSDYTRRRLGRNRSRLLDP